MTAAQLAARRSGGLATQQKYDTETKRAWCRKGGRPQLQTIAELRAIEALNKKNKRGGRGTKHYAGTYQSGSEIKSLSDQLVNIYLREEELCRGY